MKRKNTTRNALFTSIISLLLCVSMLVGTTFAWFTDSVVSGNNVIAAGNLDIELYNDGNKVTESTNLFDGITWEPGVVDYENFTIKNEGNLALLYDFAINWGDYNTLAGQYNLTQILKVAMIDGHVSGDRAAAIAAGNAAGWKALDSWSFSGEMNTKGESKEFALIIYWEPSENDNNWNVQNGKTLDKGDHLYVNLGINLQATQKMHESDSFGTDYDALANPWDGSIGEVPAPEDNVITLTTAAELAAFAESVNNGTTYSGKTVKLDANINLNNQPWTAIGDCESGKYFQGTFDGQGHTIYNLSVDYSNDPSQHATAGLFGWVDVAKATVKNVNVDGATVKGSHWVGVIAGYFTGTIENCSVNNATVIGYNVNDDANGDKLGGIVGCLNEHSYLNNNTVTNSTITGNRDIGGIAGSVAASTYAMKNNKVSNTTITYNTTKDYASAGEIVSGRTGYVADNSNVATNVTIIHAIATIEDLKKTIQAGETDIVLAAGNITIDNSLALSGKTVTITGTKDTVINMPTGTDQSTTGANLVFDGVTINYSDTGSGNIDNYKGIKHASSVTYKNCTINGLQFLYADTVAFENCDLNTTKAEHCVWTYGGNTVTFTGCDFTYVDRAVNCYSDQASDSSNVTFTNCTFTKVAGKDTTGAIETNSSLMTALTLTINNCSVNEGDLWWVSEWDKVDDVHSGAKTYTTVDGKVTVGTAKQLAAVVAKGAADISLLDGEYNLSGCNGKTLTISGTKDAVIKIVDDGEHGHDAGCDGATVTFNGVTFNSTANAGQYKGFTRMNGTYNDCAFVGSYTTSSGVHKFYNCEFDLRNNYVWTWGASEVLFDNCTFEDANGVGKAILVHEGAAVTSVTVRNCTFTANTAAYTWDGLHVAAVSIDPNGADKQITVNFEGANTVVTAEGATADNNGNTGFAGLHQIKYANESKQIEVTINGEVVNNIVATDYNPNL